MPVPEKWLSQFLVLVSIIRLDSEQPIKESGFITATNQKRTFSDSKQPIRESGFVIEPNQKREFSDQSWPCFPAHIRLYRSGKGSIKKLSRLSIFKICTGSCPAYVLWCATIPSYPSITSQDIPKGCVWSSCLSCRGPRGSLWTPGTHTSIITVMSIEKYQNRLRSPKILYYLHAQSNFANPDSSGHITKSGSELTNSLKDCVGIIKC